MYAIYWRRLLTNFTGHGEPVFNSTKDIEREVFTLNQKWSGVIIHWYQEEPCP